MPNPRNKKAPQTPGEAPKAEQMPPQETQEAQETPEPSTPAEPVAAQEPQGSDAGDSITISKADLAELVAAQVAAQVDQAAAQAVHKFRRDQQAGKVKKQKLPPADEFDAETMTRAELSEEGWVVPVAFPDDKKRAQQHH